MSHTEIKPFSQNNNSKTVNVSNSRGVALELVNHIWNWLEIIDHYLKSVFIFYISYIHILAYKLTFYIALL